MAMDENIFIDYYAKRKTLGIPEVPITCNDKVIKKFFVDYLDRYLKNNVPLYITTAGLAYDDCGRMATLLNKYYRLEPLGCKINEDWHHSCLKLFLFKDCWLFIISYVRLMRRGVCEAILTIKKL